MRSIRTQVVGTTTRLDGRVQEVSIPAPRSEAIPEEEISPEDKLVAGEVGMSVGSAVPMAIGGETAPSLSSNQCVR